MFFLQHKVIKKTEAQTSPGLYNIDSNIPLPSFKCKQIEMRYAIQGAGGGGGDNGAGLNPRYAGGNGGDGELLNGSTKIGLYITTDCYVASKGLVGGFSAQTGGSLFGDDSIQGTHAGPGDGYGSSGGSGGGATHIIKDSTSVIVARGGGGGGGGAGGLSNGNLPGGNGGNGGGLTQGAGGAKGLGGPVSTAGTNGTGYTGGGAGGLGGIVGVQTASDGGDGSFSADIYIYL